MSFRLITLCFLAIFTFIGCKKNYEIIDLESTSEFPNGEFNVEKTSSWRAEYKGGSTQVYDVVIDSIYFSPNSVEVKILSDQGDTTLRSYQILLVDRSITYKDTTPQYISKGESYGVFRVENNRVYGFHTLNFAEPTVLGNYVFKERVLYDHNLVSGDELNIKTNNMYHDTKVLVDNNFKQGILKQVFVNRNDFSDTLASRFQYGFIMNTNRYITAVLSNGTRATPLLPVSLIYFRSPNYSVEILHDTSIYP